MMFSLSQLMCKLEYNRLFSLYYIRNSFAMQGCFFVRSQEKGRFVN